MESFFSRYKNILVLVLVLMAQFFLVAVQVRKTGPAAAVDQAGLRALRYGVTSVVTPPEGALHKSGMGVRGIWDSYLDLVGVRQQNEELQAQIHQLQLEQASLAEDARQGERLQDLLAFKQHYIDTTVPAQVIGTSGTDRSRIIYIDKGSEDGIATDMPVITPDGIVGRILDVSAHSSQVLEISDPTSASGVLLEETRTRGIVRGNGAGRPQIVNLMPDDRIKPGQLVLTSGGDQIFPRGLPVGIVDKIVPDTENEPMVDVILKPAANLTRLEEVLVVTGLSTTPTPRSKHDLQQSVAMVAAEKAAVAKAAADAAAAAEAQRASDILAQRLPSRDVIDPDAPDAAPGSSPATTEAEAKPLHPPSALHPDHYSSADVPPAASLTPGQRLGAYVEGTPETERRVKKTTDTAGAEAPAPSVGTNSAFTAASAAVVAKHRADAAAKAKADADAYAAAHPAPPAHEPAVAAAPGTSSAASAGTPGTAGATAAPRPTRTIIDPVTGLARKVYISPAPSTASAGAAAPRPTKMVIDPVTGLPHRVYVTPNPTGTTTAARPATATGAPGTPGGASGTAPANSTAAASAAAPRPTKMIIDPVTGLPRRVYVTPNPATTTGAATAAHPATSTGVAGAGAAGSPATSAGTPRPSRMVIDPATGLPHRVYTTPVPSAAAGTGTTARPGTAVGTSGNAAAGAGAAASSGLAGTPRPTRTVIDPATGLPRRVYVTPGASSTTGSAGSAASGAKPGSSTAAPRRTPGTTQGANPSEPNAGTSGTATARKPAPGTAPSTAAKTPSTTPGPAQIQVRTQVITDGPIPGRAAAPRPSAAPSKTPSTATKPAAPKRKGPEIVPDDGSRPPPKALPAATPQTPPASPQEHP